VLHLQLNFVCCWKLNTSGNIPELPCKFRNVLEKIVLANRVKNEILQRDKGNEHPTYNEINEG